MNGRRSGVVCLGLMLAACATAACSPGKDKGGDSSSKPGASAAASSSAKAAAPAMVEVVLPPIKKGEQKKQTLGGKELKAEICKVDKAGPVMKDESFSKVLRDLAVAPDGKIYVLDNEVKLRRYYNQKPDGCELALDKTFGKDGILDLGLKPDAWHNSLSIDKAGTVYVSKDFGSGESKKVVDGKIAEVCGEDLQTSPDAKVLMSNLVPVKDDKCDGAKVELKGTAIDSPTVLSVAGDLMGVKGTVKDPDKKDHTIIKAGLYGIDGTQKALVGKSEGDEDIFYAHDVQACSLGLCVIDGNARRLRVWKADGSFVGAIEIDDLAGTSTMPQHGVQGKNEFWIGSSASGEGDDKSDYGIIIRVTGM